MKTIAQTYIDQGYEQGRIQARQEMEQEIQKLRQEAQAKERQCLLSSIELGLELKFGKEGLRLFNEVKQIQEMSLLIIIRAALKFVSDLGELHFKGQLLRAISDYHLPARGIQIKNAINTSIIEIR